MILRRIFIGKLTGFYVDIGAHHPKRFSNTYIFYQRGWRGINIDAKPGTKEVFNKLRPRDINLEVPISELVAFCSPVPDSLIDNKDEMRSG